MPLVSEVYTEARMLLNDTAATLYTDAVLLPVIVKAYRELQQELGNHGIATDKEQTAAFTVPAGVKTIEFGATLPNPALPTNLLYPIQMHEKINGESDDRFQPMFERPWVPDIQLENKLKYWVWQDDIIKLIGANTDVPVRLRFFGALPDLTGPTDDLLILDSITFLGARVAAIAAFAIGNSPEKASGLMPDAEKALNVLLSRNVKNRQAMPVRRKPFKAFRFRPHFRT